jgi:LysR family transcriptional regulator, transcriptional activator of the cysJI operon
MDLRLLPTFVAVAQCRHFGRAASIVNLSQPAVSHQISQLEESLGARLFNRDGRRVTLTVAGEALLEEARAILDSASRAESRLREVTSGSVGRVRIGATETAALYYLPPILSDYRLRFPKYECRLWIGTASEVEDRVVRHELDMAVVAGSRPHGELRAVELSADPAVLIGRRGTVKPRKVTTAQLQSSDWILREEGSDARRDAIRWLEGKRLTRVRTVTVNGPSAVVEAVAAGLGLAMVSERAARHAREAGRIDVLDPGPALPARSLWLVDHPHKHHGAACQAMLAALTSSVDRPKR